MVGSSHNLHPRSQRTAFAIALTQLDIVRAEYLGQNHFELCGSVESTGTGVSPMS